MSKIRNGVGLCSLVTLIVQSTSRQPYQYKIVSLEDAGVALLTCALLTITTENSRTLLAWIFAPHKLRNKTQDEQTQLSPITNSNARVVYKWARRVWRTRYEP